ncbi:MAG: zinc-binding alcohol dehydrogenase, partial [Proteobacteria bacterium]|nr:zinc-binding alcohol dehydrogenase [Pseudomonadota bacterium]
MKALLTNFKTGDMSVTEVPAPVVKAGGVLVHNAASLISAGTEKAVIELAKMNSLQKARARPDLVRKVLRKVVQEGIIGTARNVRARMNTPIPLGYSCAGIAKEIGAGVTDIHPGQRVACAGMGYANHAEAVFVPRNLLVPIPEGVGFQDAAFVTVGAIAMHGIRQAGANLGEAVAIIGLGLVGQITAQICTAAGYRVFGIDLDPEKVRLAMDLGAEGGVAMDEGDVASAVNGFTRGRGVDAVLITAGTKSNDPIELAAEIARDRAIIVAVGDIGLGVPRRPFYAKELELRLSRSYGPGRYDALYEERGHDYPVGYVRWTENRNMEAFLDLVAAGRVRLEPLITRSYPIEEAAKAYELLSGKQNKPFIGILLSYDHTQDHAKTVSLKPAAEARSTAKPEGQLGIGVIGAGAFAQGVLLPKLKSLKDVDIRSVASERGLSARAAADKYGAAECT